MRNVHFWFQSVAQKRRLLKLSDETYDPLSKNTMINPVILKYVYLSEYTSTQPVQKELTKCSGEPTKVLAN